MLPPQRLKRLESEAGTFWEVYTYIHPSKSPDVTGVLDDGLKATDARGLGWHEDGEPFRGSLPIREWQVRLARDLLGALAFAMFCGKDGTGDSGPLFDVAGDVPAFLRRVFNDRFLPSGAYQTALGRPINENWIWEDWEHLVAMNSYGLKHLVFSETEKQLKFVDITTQAFFAAYWACRWASSNDRRRLWKWVPDPITGSNEVYQELWTFVVEMPADAIDREHWESLLSPLYDQQRPIRATELIYRSWERMKDTAAGQTFRNEFAQILEGDQGEERQQIARGLLFDEEGKSHFLPLCKGAQGKKDTGEFQMGALPDEEPGWDSREGKQNNPLHPVRLTPYRLHRYCMTNAGFELFDPRHEADRVFKKRVQDVDGHPVVNIRWYDAWCLAMWLGTIKVDGEAYEVTLPSEAQWEYACRAGESTPFTWSEALSGDKVESEYCNFNGDHPWHRPGTPAAENGPDRGRTVRVDGLDEDGTEFPANRWGFYHMHGNVGEWCADWYGRDYYLLRSDARADDPRGPENGTVRILRGGGWFGFGWLCRSASRNADRPGFRNGCNGFRLAAVPASGKQ